MPSVGRVAVLELGGARQQHDLVGDLRGRGPDLLPVDDVAARHLLGEGLDARGVEPGIGLGEAEAALVLARDQPRQPARLLLGRAVHHDRVRAEQVDVDGRGRGHAAAVAGDLVHHDRRLGHAEPGAAVFLAAW